MDQRGLPTLCESLEAILIKLEETQKRAPDLTVPELLRRIQLGQVHLAEAMLMVGIALQGLMADEMSIHVRPPKDDKEVH